MSRFSKCIPHLIVAGLLVSTGAVSDAAPATRALILVGLPEKPAWQDMAYLAAVPAASHRTGRAPAVIAIPTSGKIGRELDDYLSRYKPTETIAIGLDMNASPPADTTWTILKAGSAAEASRKLAVRFWDKCDRAVICRDDRYGSALLASSLAARLNCPLLLTGDGEDPLETYGVLKTLGANTAIIVGDAPARPSGAGGRTVRVAGAEAAIRYLKDAGLPCDYLAVTNPFDRAGTMQTKLSLVAPLFCAARDGLVVPMEYESHWMAPAEAAEVKGKRAAGLPKDAERIYTGTTTLAGRKTAFAVVPGGKAGQIYVDVDGDGNFAGKAEGPLRSTNTVTVGGVAYSVVAAGPDRRNRRRKIGMTTCTPTAEAIQDRLRAIAKLAEPAPSNLLIVGHPDAVPFWLYPDGPGAATFLQTDVPYANTDGDPFFEMNVGRIIAESAHFATLHASRVATYTSLLDPRWSHSVGFARWEDSLGPQFANVGFYNQYLHTKHDRPEVAALDKPLAPGARRGRIRREGSFAGHSPLTNVSAITHGAHSWFMGLGETYTVEAKALLSPCVVESAGCGPTALHADRKFISVVSHLFRNGAVAFHGNAVPSPAPHQELRYGFWTSVLGGSTVGDAHRDTLNRKMLTVLASGQLERGGTDRRTLFARHLYGDPAFQMYIPATRRVAPARTTVDGDQLTVHGPQQWYVAQIRVPEDWKRWVDKPLYVLRAPGVYIRANWCGDQYDREEVYADVAWTTRRKVKSIRQTTKLPVPLGWPGTYHADANADGTTTYRWRIRMADFDQTTGTIRAAADRIDYRIESP